MPEIPQGQGNGGRGKPGNGGKRQKKINPAKSNPKAARGGGAEGPTGVGKNQKTGAPKTCEKKGVNNSGEFKQATQVRSSFHRHRPVGMWGERDCNRPHTIKMKNKKKKKGNRSRRGDTFW